MELGLKGRTAVIAGGSMGIGKAAARSLAAEGANLVLLARGKTDQPCGSRGVKIASKLRATICVVRYERHPQRRSTLNF